MIRLFPSALLAVLALLSSGPRAAPEDELLEPDQAFALSTRVVNAETIEAGWKIAPGYYMYRDKFKFEVIGGDVVVRPAVFPPGKKKQDPLFGLVETYTKSVTVQLPLARRQTGAQSMRLRITAQGCNEPIGVCYSPIVKEVTFALPAGAANADPRAEAAWGQLVFRSADGRSAIYVSDLGGGQRLITHVLWA